jgi:hypothetical protein
MATATNPAYLSLYRIKYLNDPAEIEVCKYIFIRWAYRSMVARKVDPQGYSRLGVQALMAWVGDVCQTCHGQQYQKFAGAPSLSDRTCPACHGLGKNRIRTGSAATKEVIQDVIERADSSIYALRLAMVEKIGR